MQTTDSGSRQGTPAGNSDSEILSCPLSSLFSAYNHRPFGPSSASLFGKSNLKGHPNSTHPDSRVLIARTSKGSWGHGLDSWWIVLWDM